MVLTESRILGYEQTQSNPSLLFSMFCKFTRFQQDHFFQIIHFLPRYLFWLFTKTSVWFLPRYLFWLLNKSPVWFLPRYMYTWQQKKRILFNIHLIPETLIKTYPKWYEHAWTGSCVRANLVGPTSPMLHTKSQGHWPFGSREDI